MLSQMKHWVSKSTSFIPVCFVWMNSRFSSLFSICLLLFTNIVLSSLPSSTALHSCFRNALRISCLSSYKDKLWTNSAWCSQGSTAERLKYLWKCSHSYKLFGVRIQENVNADKAMGIIQLWILKSCIFTENKCRKKNQDFEKYKDVYLFMQQTKNWFSNKLKKFLYFLSKRWLTNF